ncbi:GDP-mannose 4,6-dehydratase [Candidatus Desulfarcum epimagneticum]|uniref:GDP-mannose 4,6-dehydratase n=1 Tax=uncultured Desulfobacteraceae bacterium TaxID=218296 RepID=A0A484HJ23_9BACT|nr:GDP-mannose 4,6-dehydratase [uncultured Desulfobacteraceae bacterium]
MILLTGIAGKSGKWFLKNLNDDNSPLNKKSYRAIIRTTSNVELIDQSRLCIEKAYGDLNDETFLEDALKDISIVFHIAGIHTSMKVVNAAIKNSVDWIVLVHTTGIYSKYKSASEEYISIEKEIEQITKDSNIPVTILRPTMIYGSINDRNVAIFIRMVDKLRIFPVVSHAKFPLQPVHEKDLGNAYYQVLLNEKTTKGKKYILSGKSPIMLIDIFKTIAKLLEKRNLYVSIPFPIAYLGSYLLYLISFKKIDYRERVQRLVEPRTFSHDDASRDFAYFPMAFEKGIVNEVKEYLESKTIRNN